ncbi:NPC intracellular cholesterol transporter 2 [Procambarus clarkii]|uniref:NPC intracellular cholesterol transporter 2 n=1 Tax=Procambarus clarkii TaxID=6728 RepID=UPI001E670709|nr:uncharacterized protein LOC123765780 [Procambarus clarkii]XP_045610481.1 uncharacterized protein LOC123765780 [Procambarus clarkii]
MVRWCSQRGATKVVPWAVMMVMVWCVQPGLTIRVDDKEGFGLCNVPQVGKLQTVAVKECSKWPCLAQVGRSGTYEVTFTQETENVIYSIESSIYVWVKLPFVHGGRKPVRVVMPGEKGKDLCGHISPPCPLRPGVPTTISKSITIPLQARLAQGTVVVEFTVMDEQDRVLICFRAPVIVV